MEIIEDQVEARERVRLLMSKNGFTNREFSKQLDIAEQSVSKMLNGTRTLTDGSLFKMAKVLKVPFELLKDGEGFDAETLTTSQLLKGEAKPLEVVNEDDVFYNWAGSEFRDLSDGRVLMTIPLVDEFAQAGYLAGWKDPEFIEELPKHSIVVAKRHTGKYRAFEVVGDSMDSDRRDAICAGDIVVGRSIDKTLWNTKFHLHRFKDYLIVHQDGVIIKRITAHNVEEGIITCASTNPDKEAYPDFEVRLSEVYEIYNIVSVERKWKA
ncbi:LexA family transcriptional regulator [Rudanella lutea]|uniref:LexA family transcriptional regulator n=1 Tax=Rudanella lutea TaxID=451374 RepID=UPI00146F6328|nr:LexA family transcriptional regulator [Rudanella lutea]